MHRSGAERVCGHRAYRADHIPGAGERASGLRGAWSNRTTVCESCSARMMASRGWIFTVSAAPIAPAFFLARPLLPRSPAVSGNPRRLLLLRCTAGGPRT